VVEDGAAVSPPTDVRPVAVLAVGAAAPTLRLAASEVAAAWGSGGGRGSVAVCDADEDTLTLAWQAAGQALAAAGVTAGEVSGLWWGTTRLPFAEGPSHAFLTTALGLDPAAEGTLCSGSPHAGMEALLGAWDALAAGHARLALVVASDALVPGVGTAGETTTGAGAVALVLGPLDWSGTGDDGSGPPARLVSRASRVMAAVDRYRGDAERATGDVYDGRVFREQVFVPLLTAAGRALTVTGPGTPPAAVADTPARWAMSDPDGRLAATVAGRLGGPLVSGPVQAALGDTGAAAALLGLVEGCDVAGGDPSVLGVIGFGGGRATAVSVEVLRPVPGADGTVARLGPGRPVVYTEAIRARGQLEPMSDPIPMGVPPAGAAFVRGNVEMLSLQGARCRHCATISTPPSIHPTCTGCGGGELDVVALARSGTVQTFVVNQTMPPPFQAPLPMVVVDLDDGARLMVQGVSADAADLAVGDVVALTLRLYAMERGIPVYGYKALRVPSSVSTNGARRGGRNEEARR
jgi:hydroxymethylglutaryl-CoA synthase